MNDSQYATINAKLDLILAGLGAATAAAKAVPADGPRVATAEELSGPHGDPEIRFDPKRWEGKSHKGLLMSQVAYEDVGFLDMLAEAFDYFARKEDEGGVKDSKGTGPKSFWTRLDAARARGWAASIRAAGPSKRASRKPRISSAGKQQTAPTAAAFVGAGLDAGEDVDIPF